MRLGKSAVQFTPYIVAIIYCTRYKSNIDLNPRSAVFAILLAQIIAFIICDTPYMYGHGYGVYIIPEILDIDYNTLDMVLMYTQVALASITPYIKGQVIATYSIGICILYLMAIIMRIVLICTGDIDALYPNVFLSLSAEIVLNYILLWFLREFRPVNIGGGWDCLMETWDDDDGDSEEYDMDYDEDGDIDWE